MTTRKSSMQIRALELMRKGLITHAEAAAQIDTSRQAIRQMAARAGIDAIMTRYRHLQKLFARVEPSDKKDAG